MSDLSDYFSAIEITKLLCKYRVAHAKKRHKIHLHRKISKNDHNYKYIHETDVELDSLSRLLPPRRKWVKLKKEDRLKYKNSYAADIERLKRTVISTHIKATSGAAVTPEWYNELQTFIADIQDAIEPTSHYRITTPEIIPEKKDESADKLVFRPLTNYSYKDRIVISLTAKYLTDIFDQLLIGDSTFAFRSVKNLDTDLLNHHTTVGEILKYRDKNLKQTIWVSECDIKKFFDCISHNTAISSFNKFSERLKLLGVKVDKRSEKLFHDYLHSYSFNKLVYPLNGSKYFEKISLANKNKNCIFEWPMNELRAFYSESQLHENSIGVPQGGAISCLIANLVLHEVDELVVSPPGSSVRYLRYCDDMIIMATTKEECCQALERYMAGITNVKLLIHEPQQVNNYNISFWGKNFKSKLPYQWGDKRISASNVPWLSFVGYQIRYDGVIRIRQKSIRKEIDKQKKEANTILKVLKVQTPKSDINQISKKSRRQQCFALESRLISMSVGRISLRNFRDYVPSFCWSSGFTAASPNPILGKQLKILDKTRNKVLYRFKKALNNLSKEVIVDEKMIAKYRGAPYSYHGFLRVNKQSKVNPDIIQNRAL